MNSLDEKIRNSGPKFPKPKILRLLLNLGLITKDANAATADAAWFAVCRDPLVAQREFDDPEPKQERDVTHRGYPTHYLFRDHIALKFVAEEMTNEERAALRERVLARRVTQIPSARIAPAEPLII